MDLRDAAIREWQGEQLQQQERDREFRDLMLSRFLDDVSFSVTTRLSRRLDRNTVSVEWHDGRPCSARFAIDGVKFVYRVVGPFDPHDAVQPLRLRVECRTFRCPNFADGPEVASLADLGRLLCEPVPAECLCDECVEDEASEAEEVSAL